MKELGNIIKDYRQKSGYSIEHISDVTKIRKLVIIAIENGEFETLPPVYGLSFLKTYIEYLKIPEAEYKTLLNEAFKIYEKSHKQTHHASIPKQQIFKPKIGSSFISPDFVNYTIYILLGLVIAIIIYLYVFHKTEEPENDFSDEIPKEKISENDFFKSNDEFLNADSITLDAFAIDTAWIKVNMDGVRYDEILLRPNTRRIWRAKEYFIIHQGNIGALEIKRNGVLLEPFGSPGSVIGNVRVTKDKIIY